MIVIFVPFDTLLMYKYVLPQYNSLLIGWCRFVSMSVRSDTRMKQLNDQKKYRQAMAVFDALSLEKQPSTTTLSVDQAIRACLELDDLQRGVAIGEKLSPTLMSNIFVQSRLIRLHSLSFLLSRNVRSLIVAGVF